jgi:ABC-type dipeptide/oligopeptide/nickel transport system ATPase component
MAQRVLIAMATVNEPRLLIADEPTTGLDVTVQAQFLDTLQSRVRDSRSAVIFVTHDLGIVAHYCDRVAVMYGGRVIEEASVDDLFARPKHAYTQRLIASSADRRAAFTRTARTTAAEQ